MKRKKQMTELEFYRYIIVFLLTVLAISLCLGYLLGVTNGESYHIYMDDSEDSFIAGCEYAFYGIASDESVIAIDSFNIENCRNPKII